MPTPVTAAVVGKRASLLPARVSRVDATGAGLLVLRTVVGITFLVHGLDKLFDLPGAEAYFAGLGIPAPGPTALFVGLLEADGGVLLIVGLATRLAALSLSVDMLVAYLTAHVGHGFLAESGGAELVMVLGGAGVALVAAGPGRYSADQSLDPWRRWAGRTPLSGTRSHADEAISVSPRSRP